MKRLLGTSIFGVVFASLCSLAACVTEVDRPAPASSVQEQSLGSPSPGNDSHGNDSLDPELSITPNSCISDCDGDEGCIICCRCTNPTVCCQ